MQPRTPRPTTDSATTYLFLRVVVRQDERVLAVAVPHNHLVLPTVARPPRAAGPAPFLKRSEAVNLFVIRTVKERCNGVQVVLLVEGKQSQLSS